MELHKAEKLLPKFQQLEGTYSNFYDSKIDSVFIAYTEGNLAELQYKTNKKNKLGSALQSLPADGAYTIGAALESGDVVSVKSIVMQDKLQDLMQAAEQLDYLQFNGNDIDTV